LGDCLRLADLVIIAKVAKHFLATSFHGYGYALISTNNGLGYTLA
jgi:hypothetical protein